MCPRCHSEICKEMYNSDNNIDGLKHSHMKCEKCHYEFNVWHESLNKLELIFGKDNIKIYL